MMDIRKRLVGVALATAIPASACAAPAFELEDLPKPVQDQLLNLFAGEAPASSESPYNDSDSVNPELPMRRLVFSAQRGDVYFIHYAHGGYSWHTHLVGIQFNRFGTKPTINVAFFEQLDSLAKAQEALSSLRFHSAEVGWTGQANATQVEY